MGHGGLHPGVLWDQKRPLWGVALQVLDRGAEGGLAAQGQGLQESQLALLGRLLGEKTLHRLFRLGHQVRGSTFDGHEQSARSLFVPAEQALQHTFRG